MIPATPSDPSIPCVKRSRKNVSHPTRPGGKASEALRRISQEIRPDDINKARVEKRGIQPIKLIQMGHVHCGKSVENMWNITSYYVFF